MRTLILNGQVYYQRTIQRKDILIEDGEFKQIADDLSNYSVDKVIDASGLLVTPGLIDMHVHFRDPGYTQKEDLNSGSRASVHGGVTTVGAMANVDPVPDTPDKFQIIAENNQRIDRIRIKQFAPITKDLRSEELVDFEELANLGAVGFSNDGFAVQSSNTMYLAMQKAKSVGLPIAAHIEEEELRYGGAMNQGNQSRKLGIPGILDISETTQLARDLVLAKKTGVHYHACHLTRKESVNLVRLAKADGVNVTAEVTPHHLVLTDQVIESDVGTYKVNPPLTSEEDRIALLEGLVDGTIDIIATDHAPHTREEKTVSMVKSAYGLTGLETSFAVLYTKLVRTGQISLTKLLEKMTKSPAKVYGLSSFGEIKPGSPADLALFDLGQTFKVTEDGFYSKSKNSPFIDWTLHGQTVYTITNGQIVYER